jgi:hypothetical protein
MIMLLRVTGLGGDTLWPHRVVLATPAFDQDLCFGQRVEDLAVEQFIAQLVPTDSPPRTASTSSFGFPKETNRTRILASSIR